MAPRQGNRSNRPPIFTTLAPTSAPSTTPPPRPPRSERPPAIIKPRPNPHRPSRNSHPETHPPRRSDVGSALGNAVTRPRETCRLLTIHDIGRAPTAKASARPKVGGIRRNLKRVTLSHHCHPAANRIISVRLISTRIIRIRISISISTRIMRARRAVELVALK